MAIGTLFAIFAIWHAIRVLSTLNTPPPKGKHSSYCGCPLCKIEEALTK